jgi:hypothetical protein
VLDTVDFACFDDKREGRVNRAAFVGKPNPAFRLLAKRHDCRLTSDELRAAYSSSAKGGGKGDGGGGRKSKRGNG